MTTAPQPSGEGHPTDGRYYATGGVVWKAPLHERDVIKGNTKITIGFRVCQMSDVVGDEAAETVAALMNAGDRALNGPPPPSPSDAADLAAARTEIVQLQAMVEGGNELLADATKALEEKVTRVTELESAVQLPKEMTPAMAEVLGRPNFMCSPIAEAYRSGGHNIPRKAEAEQAFVLFRFLPFAIRFGDDWTVHASSDLKKAQAECGPGEA